MDLDPMAPSSLQAMRYNPDLDGKGTGQLTINEKAVVGPEHRLLRVVWFVALLQPDVICFQARTGCDEALSP